MSEEKIGQSKEIKMSFTNKRYGWIHDIPDQRDHLYAAPTAALVALPPKVDLRPRCPQVYDQGQLGSCTANGIAGAMQFDRMKQKLKPKFTPSRLFIYYNERVIEGTVSSDSGAQIRDGIKVVAKEGDCPETEWPYDIAKFTNKPSAQCYKDALKYKAIQYQRVAQKVNQMKGCLASGYPFVYGLPFMRASKARRWQKRESFRCRRLAKRSWGAIVSSRSAMMIPSSVSLRAIRGEQPGECKVILPFPMPIL